MKISIIIPTFKGSDVISRALDSLTKQSFKDFEVIVVDDNGENTEEQIKTEKNVSHFLNKLNLRYYKHAENKNGSAARNTGLAKSKGDYISFLDDDDILLKNRLYNACKELENNSLSNLVFCNVLIQRNDKLIEIIEPYISNDIEKELIYNTTFFGTGSNIFFRKEILKEVKGFDERYFRRQDNEFLLRVLKNNKYSVINNIDIIKCNNGIGKIPTYEKLIKANKMYYEDFAYLINRLSDEELNNFYINENSRILFCCMMNENKDIILSAKKNVELYRSLTRKEKIQLFLSRIKIGNYNLLKYIQPILSKIKNSKKHAELIKILDDELINEINEYKIIK